MIQDHTIDQCLMELARTMEALKALRAARKDTKQTLTRVRSKPWSQYHVDRECTREHAATKRASLDLTRALADLRAGRYGLRRLTGGRPDNRYTALRRDVRSDYRRSRGFHRCSVRGMSDRPCRVSCSIRCGPGTSCTRLHVVLRRAESCTAQPHERDLLQTFDSREVTMSVHLTQAQCARRSSNPYLAAVATHVYRDVKGSEGHQHDKKIFYFEDGSFLTFEVTYTSVDDGLGSPKV